MAATSITGSMKITRTALTGAAQAITFGKDVVGIDVMASGNSILLSDNDALDATNSWPIQDGEKEFYYTSIFANNTVYVLGASEAGYIIIREWKGMQT